MFSATKIKTAYILVGIPGSGKSTWAESQKWFEDCAYVSTDFHIDFYAKTVGKTYNEVFEEHMPIAIDNMLDDLSEAKWQELDIIWDQTSTTSMSRAKKIHMLQGYKKIAVVFRIPPAEELDRRLASRPGKVIPRKVVDDMIKNFEEPTLDEGFDDIWWAE
jgi:predicted kinase